MIDAEDDRDRVTGGERYANSLVALGTDVFVCFCLLVGDGVCGIFLFGSLSSFPSISAVGFRFMDNAGADSGVKGLSSDMCMNWLSCPLKLVILLTGTSSVSWQASLSTMVVIFS